MDDAICSLIIILERIYEYEEKNVSSMFDGSDVIGYGIL